MKTPNRKGFTLIEIIVVLIILGVLAAIGLPSIYMNIDRTKSLTNLYAAIASVKNNLVPCVSANHGNEQKCYNAALSCTVCPSCPSGYGNDCSCRNYGPPPSPCSVLTLPNSGSDGFPFEFTTGNGAGGNGSWYIDITKKGPAGSYGYNSRLRIGGDYNNSPFTCQTWPGDDGRIYFSDYC